MRIPRMVLSDYVEFPQALERSNDVPRNPSATFRCVIVVHGKSDILADEFCVIRTHHALLSRAPRDLSDDKKESRQVSPVDSPKLRLTTTPTPFSALVLTPLIPLSAISKVKLKNPRVSANNAAAEEASAARLRLKSLNPPTKDLSSPKMPLHGTNSLHIETLLAVINSMSRARYSSPLEHLAIGSNEFVPR